MDYDDDGPVRDKGKSWIDAAQILYGTWQMHSGASPGALNILKACHNGEGPIDMMDLYRLDPGRQRAALDLIRTSLLLGCGLDRLLAANQVRRIEEATRDGR